MVGFGLIGLLAPSIHSSRGSYCAGVLEVGLVVTVLSSVLLSLLQFELFSSAVHDCGFLSCQVQGSQ
jgi:hypothetical protein